jgi:hypothetical protein
MTPEIIIIRAFSVGRSLQNLAGVGENEKKAYFGAKI